MMITEVCDHAAFAIRPMLSRKRMRRVAGSMAPDVGSAHPRKSVSGARCSATGNASIVRVCSIRVRAASAFMSGSMRKKARNASSTGTSGVERL